MVLLKCVIKVLVEVLFPAHANVLTVSVADVERMTNGAANWKDEKEDGKDPVHSCFLPL